MQVAGKVFVVTGAGNGIGRCVAVELVRRGAVVAGADLNEQALAATAELVGDRTRFSPHRLDIGDRDAVRAFPDTVIAVHGHVDGVFNIAGIAQQFQTVTEVDDDRIETLMRVNFFGAVWMCRAFLPHLSQRPEAAIMNTSSMSAIVPVPGSTLYGASKAALAVFGYGLAQDLSGGRSNITVTTAIPGTVWTDLVRASAKELGAPEAAARAVAAKPERVAHRMIEATMRGRTRVVIGKDAHIYNFTRRLSSRLAARLAYLQVGKIFYARRAGK